MTTEEALQKIFERHPQNKDLFDYSLFQYTKARNKTTIICRKCGFAFEQSYDSHLKGSGCMRCAGTYHYTSKEFIEKVLKRNPQNKEKYDYSLTEYINADTKVKVICNNCKTIFEQNPTSHLNGAGCVKCRFVEGSRRKTTEEWLKEVLENNPGNIEKYDYSKTVYLTCHEDVEIFCKKHQIYFWQSAITHFKGAGCPKCCGRFKTTEEFIAEARKVHGDKYDYSTIDYRGIKNKIIVTCPTHGAFEISTNNLLQGRGCYYCGMETIHAKQRKTTEEWIEEVLENNPGNAELFDYSDTEYFNAKTKVKIFCKKHQTYFMQSPYSHYSGCGCPICKQSYGERRIQIFLSGKIEYITQWKHKDCKDVQNLIFDFYIPKLNTVIEYQGEQHFQSVDFFGGEENFEKQKKRDQIKRDFCKENNIKEIEISYLNFDDIENVLQAELFDNF